MMIYCVEKHSPVLCHSVNLVMRQKECEFFVELKYSSMNLLINLYIPSIFIKRIPSRRLIDLSVISSFDLNQTRNPRAYGRTNRDSL